MGKLEISQLGVNLQGKSILKNCSFTANAGEFVGIVGPNGAGKSTLLKALRGLIPISTGSISVDGVLLSTMKDKSIARQIAYMQQNLDVGFGYSAKEIVMTARYPYLKWWENESKADESIAEEMMRFTGVWHLRDHAINSVSGGERQRIFLAKVLAQESQILLLDEPTAALDMVYEDEIFRFCKNLCDKGKTIVVVVHDLEIAAKFCSRILMISKNTIVADGLPEQVLQADNLKEFFQLSSSVYEDPFFGQLRIFVYPAGEKTSEAYLQHSLPKEASTAFVIDDKIGK